jgi:hypothetical protein
VSKAGYGAQSWAQDVGDAAVRREIGLVPTGSFAAEVQSWTIGDAGGDADSAVDPGESVTLAVRATATGGALGSLTAILSTADPYVSITTPGASWPSIAAGGSADPIAPFAFSVSPQTPDGHVVSFHVAFSASQVLCTAGGQGTTIEVPVTIGAATCPAIAEPLDVNPGWTIQNSDALGWAFGSPVGGGGLNGPTTGHTGTKVYGTNLTGQYGNDADYKLVTTPFNLTRVRGAELRFWRWLNDEAGYDLASVDRLHRRHALHERVVGIRARHAVGTLPLRHLGARRRAGDRLRALPPHHRRLDDRQRLLHRRRLHLR